MVYETLVTAALDFVDWGIGIVLIMLVWETYKFFSVGGKAEDVAKGTWKGASKLVNRIRHKGKTKALNEAIVEQDELNLIDAITTNHAQLATTVKTVRASSQLYEDNVKDIDQQTDALQDIVNEAIKRFRKLNRVTLRQERVYLPKPALGLNTKNIEKVLRERGIDPAVFMAEEKKLLERHKTALEALQKVSSFVNNKVGGARGAFVKLPVITGAITWPIIFAKSTSDIDKQLNKLETTLDDPALKAEIKIAEDAQHEALKDMQGIITSSRKMWA